MAETVAPYEEAHAGFRLEDEEAKLSGSLTEGLNACVECCDRWAVPGKVALEWEDQEGHRATVTFVELRERAARFANVLKAHGVGPGDIVACMLPRIPDLLTVALGTWRAGAVYQPMFTAFGPKAIGDRLQTSGAKLIVTDPANRPKLDEIPNAPLDRGDDADLRRRAEAPGRSRLRRRGRRRLA